MSKIKNIKLTKPKAKQYITFKVDKDDDHFTYIVFSENKSDKELKRTMIITKDREDFINGYVRDGWVVS